MPATAPPRRQHRRPLLSVGERHRAERDQRPLSSVPTNRSWSDAPLRRASVAGRSFVIRQPPSPAVTTTLALAVRPVFFDHQCSARNEGERTKTDFRHRAKRKLRGRERKEPTKARAKLRSV